MKEEPLKGKLRFKDEDDLQQYACDEIFKCSGEQPTESNPVGCEGCDAQEEWVEKNYSDMVIDESTEKQFASKQNIKLAVEWYKEKHRDLLLEVQGLIIDYEEYIVKNNKLIDKAFEDVTKK